MLLHKLAVISKCMFYFYVEQFLPVKAADKFL